MDNTFFIDRSENLGKQPVFMIGMDNILMDYELSYYDLIKLQDVLKKAIEEEKSRMN